MLLTKKGSDCISTAFRGERNGGEYELLGAGGKAAGRYSTVSGCSRVCCGCAGRLFGGAERRPAVPEIVGKKNENLFPAFSHHPPGRLPEGFWFPVLTVVTIRSPSAMARSGCAPGRILQLQEIGSESVIRFEEKLPEHRPGLCARCRHTR